jgi:HEPN domain-containing protein
MKRLTREWVRKAESDIEAAHRLTDRTGRFRDQTCFHCQQSAEKYLKAVLQAHGLPFGRTHDLEDLLDALAPVYANFNGLRRGLQFLTQFAVDPRYAGFRATKRQATAAMRWAIRVRGSCRLALGIALESGKSE